MLKRTQQEIKARYEARAEEHKFFEVGEYLRFLTWENAYPYLGAYAEEKNWRAAKEDPIKLVKREVSFVKSGINDELPVSDCIERVLAWLWLAKETKLLAKVEKEYNLCTLDYERTIMKTICEHFDWKEKDENGT